MLTDRAMRGKKPEETTCTPVVDTLLGH